MDEEDKHEGGPKLENLADVTSACLIAVRHTVEWDS